MEDDSDYEVESECLLHVSVSGLLQEDLNLESDLRFIQLDSDNPIVQVGNQVFEGEYEDTVGTSLFFSATENTEPADPVFGNKVPYNLTYLDSTRKKLKLKRVFLKAKPSEAGESNQKTTKESDTKSSSDQAASSQ